MYLYLYFVKEISLFFSKNLLYVERKGSRCSDNLIFLNYFNFLKREILRKFIEIKITNNVRTTHLTEFKY